MYMYLLYHFFFQKEHWNYKSELRKLLTYSEWEEGNRVERGKGVTIPCEIFIHSKWVQTETKKPSFIQVNDITEKRGVERNDLSNCWTCILNTFWI